MTHRKTGAARGETRLFVSSLERGALTPRQRLARGRGHWAVESANHDRRDVTWREDQELGRHARRACNLALLRSARLGALLRAGSINLSARTQSDASHPAVAFRFLRSAPAQLCAKPENRGDPRARRRVNAKKRRGLLPAVALAPRERED